MSQYDNTNRGTLGKNKRKEKDTHPDYAGKINIEGVEYWLSGWLREKDGEKFFSLSVKPKEPRRDEVQEFRGAVERTFGSPRNEIRPLDDEIPF